MCYALEFSEMLWFLFLIFYLFYSFSVLSVSQLILLLMSAWPCLTDTVNTLSAWQQWEFFLLFFSFLHHRLHLLFPSVSQSIGLSLLLYVDTLSLPVIHRWSIIPSLLSPLLIWRSWEFLWTISQTCIQKNDMPIKTFISKLYRWLQPFHLYSWVQLRVIL